jgi:hypothetical protein
MYPTRSGLAKSIGDAIGQNHSGLQLHRHLGAVRRCRENVALILKQLPESQYEEVAVEAGFENLAAFGAFVETLPSAV